MSQLAYNGVTLSYLSTQRVSFDPVYDDLAGRDYLYTKITIDVNFIITPGQPPALAGEAIADTMRRVSHLLNTPRRSFTYVSGEKTLVSVAGIDANNGPLAKCDITQVVGGEALNCSLQITTFIVDCGGSGGPPYVSNRWTETADINELAYTTTTRTGQIVARSDMQPNADQLRTLTIPPLKPDFRRLRSEYQLSADGLRLRYTHVDEEQWLMPPNPAAKAEGRMSVYCGDGASFWGEVHLRLLGGKPTDKAILMRRAVQIALAKLHSAGIVPNNNRSGSYVLFCTYSEDMYANDVSVQMRALVQPTGKMLTTSNSLIGLGAGLIVNAVGFFGLFKGNPPASSVSPPPAANPAVSSADTLNWLKIPFVHVDSAGGQFDAGARGTAQLLLTAAALQDPCLRQTVNTQTGQLQNTRSGVQSLQPAAISVVGTLPDFDNALRADNENGVYEKYLQSSRTSYGLNTLTVPTAGKPAIIQTGGTTATRRVEWSVSKIGGPPTIPNPDTGDPNMVPVKIQIDPGTLGMVAGAALSGGAGALLRYTVRGCYDYTFIDPDKARIASTIPPWMRDSSAFQAAPAALDRSLTSEPGGGSFVTQSASSGVGPILRATGFTTATG